MLKKFSKLLYEPLVWKSDGMLTRSLTLYHHDEPLVHFRQEDGIFKMDASIYLAEAKEPLFVFRPKGLLNRSIEIESNDLDFVAAKLKPFSWGGGIDIDFLNGNTYQWKKSNFFGSKWSLQTADQIEIATIELSTWGAQGTITVQSDAPAPAELNLLIFAGWAQFVFEVQSAGAAA